jgi:2-desacetyl-2-hydroxyethyl bacteriochlorophyllide A dehydrogenase
MKALVYLGPKEIKLRDVEMPSPRSGEVLLKVSATGICGSDVHGYLGLTGRRIAPMVMGHEFCGIIEKTGEGVRGFKEGDHVVVQPVIFCGKCPFCKQGLTNLCTDKRFIGVLDCNGSMAEYIAVPAKLLYKVPSSFDASAGAMVEPTAVAYRAVKKAEALIKGRDILIVGAGTIGLLVLSLVKLHRPRKVIVSDLNERRLAIASKLGADAVVKPEGEGLVNAVADCTGKAGVDVAFEAVGVSATVQQALGCLKPKGTCIWVGNSQKMIQVNMQEAVTRELSVFGTYIYTHAEFGEVLKIIADRKIDIAPIISKVAPLGEGEEIFKALTQPDNELIKVILES